MANSQVTLDVNPEANAEITLLVESSRLDEGQVASDSFEPYPDCTVAAEVPAGGTNLCFPFRNVAENLGASGFVVLASLLFRWILPKWKKIFIISCVFAVLLDPLFLYIPIINGDSRCLGMDQQLNKAAFALRSITDFSYLVDIIIQFYLVEKIWRSYILVDILAILPLPQVVILLFFSKVEGWRALNTNMLMNIFALLQYVPRVLRIYFSCKELKEGPDGEIALWVKGVFNFFLYILSSHVIGAFWYFFAIQRMTACWQNACRIENGCEPTTFICSDNQFRNTTFLTTLCPLNPPNATVFDFGIFVDVLESGISESTDHPQKFSNCFWWGLRNLSSLGSDLKASINTWENLFAAFISVMGMLLFLYLIGNLQTYMQSDAARVEARKHKIKIERKVEEKGPEVSLWLSENLIFIPEAAKDNVKSQIMRKVKQELEDNRDVDVEDILSILPSELQSYINCYMMWTKLKTVPKLQSMDEKVLKAMCKHFKPLRYVANSIIIRENEPLGMMFLIMEGVVKIESSSNDVSATSLEAGNFWGEELLDWVTIALFPTFLPFSTSTVQAVNDVEARVLMASDLCAVITLFREHFSESVFTPPPDHVRFNRLGLGYLPSVRSALHIERLVESDVEH